MSQGDFQASNPYASFGGVSVADAPVDERASFIRKTYMHLAMAIYACAALCWAVFQTDLIEPYAALVFGSRWSWLVVMGVFMLGSWAASSMARSETSIGVQYAGLGIGVVCWTALLCPILWIAQNYVVKVGGAGDVNVITAASVITLVMFGGLSAIAWVSRTDFSFLGWGLRLAGFALIGLIVASIFGGFHLGVWFTVAMVVFASAYILYETSNVIHHYRPGQHVAAALELFMCIAQLFWYVLQLVMSFSSSD